MTPAPRQQSSYPSSGCPSDAAGCQPAAAAPVHQQALPEVPAALALADTEVLVPLVTGERVPYANLDYAASAPPLATVRDAVAEVLPYYASVHRGAGFASQVSTRLYEQARDTVREFVGARPNAACVFTRHTTDALNLLAHVLPRGTTVVVFETEHHANLLPWRGRRVVRLPAPGSPTEALTRLDAALRDCPVGPRLVCVTGASNVTGELWPVRQIVQVARSHGARVALDAAQLAPHQRIDVRALDVDYVALSGHKLYAPFGVGALVGRADWLRAADPYLLGGGASRRVHDDAVVWNDVPERHEAGSPNVLGAVALAAACASLAGADRAAVEAREDALLARARAGLATIPGARELSLWGPRHPRIGVLSFTVDGWDAGQVAAALSAEYGIGVRDGAFCAHLFVDRLTAANPAGGRTAVRASIGLGTTEEHVDRLVLALGELVEHGPRWTYGIRDGRPCPDPDPRPLPEFPLLSA